MAMTVSDALAAAEVVEETEGVCTIDPDSREIEVPDCYKLLGVESDEKVERLFFSCPRVVGNALDLTEANLYVNYQNASGDSNRYIIDDIEYDDDNIAFSWLLYRQVTETQGTVYFVICAKVSDDDGNVEQEWNTKVATASVGEGKETAIELEDEEYNAIEQLLLAAESLSEDASTVATAAAAAEASAEAAAEYEAAAKASAEAAAESEEAAAEDAATALEAAESATESAEAAAEASETLVSLLSDGDILTLIVDDDGGCHFEQDEDEEDE